MTLSYHPRHQLNISRYIIYRTIVCGVPICVVFMDEPDHEIWFPTKRRLPLICLLKNSKLRIEKTPNHENLYPRNKILPYNRADNNGNLKNGHVIYHVF